MGGCCSSSRKLELRGAPVYYYYQPSPEENAFLSSRSSGALLDLNLNMSAPDTYRSPPAPIPYDVVLGRPLVGSRDTALSGQFLGKHICKDIQLGIVPLSPKKTDLELLKSNPLTVAATDEEDACPTCLEEYDSENPKIMTKCNHHFHLSCILEWMERSDTCPICDQEMIYESPVGVARCD
ncbi:probable E3 ubiquitin-protein ligase RHB1A [Salvia splendens]|uniref:probable E3 ubiquitin-protein ligase RHB1A n=1 Tax=Salvia splendens TaxID=180675 RepID=UPI001C2745E1|nr:probable E3 ubiquitin-protein ligase RHB1A [Salvia splendens]